MQITGDHVMAGDKKHLSCKGFSDLTARMAYNGSIEIFIKWPQSQQVFEQHLKNFYPPSNLGRI
jgi:hypothetical protein